MESNNSVLKRLPWLLAFFVATAVTVHSLATLEASARMTHVSSTFAIAYLALPFLFVIAGLAGLILGFLLRAVLRHFNWQPALSMRQGLIITLLTTLVAAGFAWAIGTYQVAAYVEANKPQILLNQRDFQSLPLETEDHRLIPAVRAFSRMHYETPEPFTWNGEGVRVEVGDDGSLRLQTDHGTLAQMEPGYLTGVDIIDVSDAQDNAFVATLVQLRATSQRFVLYVHEPFGELVYKETLESCSSRRPVLLSRIEYNEGQALVVDQCEESLVVP